MEFCTQEFEVNYQAKDPFEKFEPSAGGQVRDAGLDDGDGRARGAEQG